MLRVGVERGELRADADLPALAAEALAFMEGAQVTWLLDPEAASLTALYTSYFDRLVDSLTPATPRRRRPQAIVKPS